MVEGQQYQVPAPGCWPAPPQQAVAISDARIWIDGCFDFAHHGHAGAMLQARRLGKELVIGIHSDEAILTHKGPTVMTLKERVAAVDACRWSTFSVPSAPYVTSLPWISHYGCQYVVHGDDISSDSSGEDCYRFVKDAGRFIVVKRTLGISTTDLVGRILLCTKDHFIESIDDIFSVEEDLVSAGHRQQLGSSMRQMIRDYATDESGLKPGSQVFAWTASADASKCREVSSPGSFEIIVDGPGPRPGQRIVYVDGAFDLFSAGHVEFLKEVRRMEKAFRQDSDSQEILDDLCESAYVVAGIHDDMAINSLKGANYPIMNIFERGLCVLQCRYIDSIILAAPFVPTSLYFNSMPHGTPHAVYHGPTTFMHMNPDPYADAKAMGILKGINHHDYEDVDAEQIVRRIVANKGMYEERQRAKGEKGVWEETVKCRDSLKQ